MGKKKPDFVVEKELKIYKDIFNFNDLENELMIWFEYKADYGDKSLSDLRAFFASSNLKEMFPQLFIAFKIYLSIPVTSAEAERSFSCLKRLKTYLRSTIGQDRLSSLAILNVERDEINNISIDETIDIFSSVKDRRMHFF